MLESKNERTLVWGIIIFVLADFPQWLASVWSLFCNKPLYQWLQDKGIAIPSFSLLWITWPIGLILLGILVRNSIKENKKPAEKPKIKTEEEKKRELLDELNRKYRPEIYEKIVTIDTAVWRPHEGNPSDVTEIVKSYVANGKLEIRCTIDVLGDPRQNIGKVLTIQYYYDGKKYTRIYEEGRIARLP